jgi:hypothetical protein
MSDQVEMLQYNLSVLQLHSLSLYMIMPAQKHCFRGPTESTPFLGLALTKLQSTKAYILQNVYG